MNSTANCTAFITNAVTGETLPMDAGEPHEGLEYLWTEGNYGCDCNRAIFFDVAGGGDGNPARECGHDAFSVKLVAGDGTVIFDETDH